MTRVDWPAVLEENELAGRVSRTQLRRALLESDVVGPTEGARADALIEEAVDADVLDAPYTDESKAISHPKAPLAFDVEVSNTEL